MPTRNYTQHSSETHLSLALYVCELATLNYKAALLFMGGCVSTVQVHSSVCFPTINRQVYLGGRGGMNQC